jgi:hypothetical protein
MSELFNDLNTDVISISDATVSIDTSGDATVQPFTSDDVTVSIDTSRGFYCVFQTLVLEF